MQWTLLHTPLKKIDFFSDFSRFFSIFAYGLNLTFAFFAITIYHNKMWKKCPQKKHKKWGKKFSTLYFIFWKWTKINVQNCFKKKSFKKRGSLPFSFIDINIFPTLSISPNLWIISLSLYFRRNRKLNRCWDDDIRDYVNLIICFVFYF